MLLLTNNDYPKIIYWTDFLTCIYLPLFLTFLHYNNSLYELKTYDKIYLIFIIASMEFVKYFIYFHQIKIPIHKHNVKDIFKSILVLTSIFLAFYIVAVLLGAPVTTNFEETSMFSLILTIITALPLCLYFGPDNTTNMFLTLITYEGNETSGCFMLKIRSSIFGAWLGATVIPLDWDRPWQVWPIPCYIGGLLGYSIGNLGALFLHIQRKRRIGKKTGKYLL